MTTTLRHKIAVVLIALCLSAFASVAKSDTEEPSHASDDIYATYGVHNDSHLDLCPRANCIYQRSTAEPTDPIYPRYWTSHWAMYRVFNRYQDNPPPYDGKPPNSLQEGKVYVTTWGRPITTQPGKGCKIASDSMVDE
jgi:hypothetical protein